MIFVTGGSGLLGNSIVRELLSRNIQVRVLCRPTSPRTPFDGLDVEIVEGDVGDPKLLAKAVAGCQAVIHCAAHIHIGWQQLELSRKVNVGGTAAIVEACLAEKVRLIYVSSVDTLPAAVDQAHALDESSLGKGAKTACAYVVSKTEAEEIVDAAITDSGLDAIVVHPGFMLGPYDWKPSSGKMMLEVNRAPVVVAPPGGCSVCDARDVAAAVVNSLDCGSSGQHYILAGENMSYRELWTRMLKTTGRGRRVLQGRGGLRLVGAAVDAFVRITGCREGDVNGAAIAMGSLRHFYISHKAEKDLRYTRRPLSQTLEDAWRWLSERKS